MGYTSVMAQYMTIPIWMVGAVFLVILSYTADATGDRRWHITGCLGLSFICTIVCVTVGNAKVQYAMLCFYIAGLYTALPLILNWTSEVISLPAEKRAVVVALVNSIGNLSAVYGSRLWPAGDSPNFIKGFATTGAFTGFGALLAASIPILLKFLPKEGRTKAERRILEQEEVVLGETDAATRT
jgi:MFS family permease